MLVSVRIEKSGSISGQCEHDFDDRPEYADSKKKADNVTVYGGSVADIKQRILDQSEGVLELHSDHVTSKRKAILEMELPSKKKQSSELRKIRGWRKDAVTHKTMIVTFDNDFYLNRVRIDREELDRCMTEFTDKFCKKNRCDVSYIVRHEDETTPHYHVTFTNYNAEKNTTHKFKQADLTAIQDLAGASFSPMGINRGIKKIDRLAMAKQASPQRNDESDQDYKYRIKKKANVIHRNVAQLHRDLPEELLELQLEIESLRIAKEKSEFLLEKTQRELLKEQELSAEKISKLEKREKTYQKRIDNAEQKASSLEEENNQLNKELQCNRDELGKLKTVISKYAQTPLPKEVSEEFTVKTGLMQHETMRLIRPSKFKKLIQHNKAHELRNGSESQRLDKLNADLGRRESDLQKRVSNFNSEVGSGVRDKISRLEHTLKTDVIQNMLNEIVGVSREVSRMDSKYNIHQGMRYGRSFTDEQQSQLRATLNTKIGKEYIDAIIEVTKKQVVEKKVAQEFDRSPGFKP